MIRFFVSDDVTALISKRKIEINSYEKIIYVFLTIFLYFLKCPQSLIL